jgi:LPXTG-motif cell wall-anchored protein
MRIMCGVVGLLLAGAAVASSQVRNAELGYTLTLPVGFQEYPPALSQKDVVQAWTETTERAGRLGRIAPMWIGIAVLAIAVLWWRKRRRAQSA